MQLDQSQARAVDRVVNGREPILLITGGAGTGKTTIIRAIIQQIRDAVLLAPTGKAAARLRDVCQCDSQTMHRYLGFAGDGIFLGRAGRGEIIIIDEASMVDSALLATLVRREPARIILVGDASQLPPVGKGQPFHDLISYRPELVSTLTTCHRNRSAIHRAASQVREGQMPAAQENTGGENWQMIQTGGPEQSTTRLLQWIAKGNLYDPDQDIIVTCRNGETDEDMSAVAGLNAAIVQAVNPRINGEKWKIGDRVMNTKNDAGNDWWNGDSAKVTDVDADGKGVWLQLDREPAGYPRHFPERAIKEMVLAYAVTVHKSQGSQWRRVYFLVAASGQRILDRSLAYTAITRGRQAVVVFGDLEYFRLALGRQNEKRTVMQLLAVQQAEVAS